MQNHYNLLYREEEREMIPLCRDAGLGIIPWSPQARGLLTRPRAESERRASERSRTDAYAAKLYENRVDWGVVDAVERVAKAHGTGMSEIALAWLLAKPGITAPIVGATKLEHLEAAIRSLDVRLGDDDIAALEAPYLPKPVEF
jgi:aryl-alcohol dehydrogenase-like predicted oxidoreductase